MEVVQMNNAKLIEGIEMAISGLTTIKESLIAEGGATAEAPKKSAGKKKDVEETPVTAPVEEGKEAVGKVVGKFSIEDLNAMKYNEFKKFASSLGVKCTGTRDEIMERILALDIDVEVDEKEAEEIKEAGGKVVPISKGKKKEDVAEEDEFDVQAKEIAEETDAEDIIEALKDVNVKATKKNYVSKLADALRKGLIELDDEDEEEQDVEYDEEYDDEELEEAEDTTSSDEEVEISADSYFAEFDPDGYNDPANMTDERADAVTELVSGILDDIENEEIGEDDILEYLEDNCTDDEKDLLDDDYTEEQLIGLYIEMKKRTVDDEGNIVEPADPYELNGGDFCCGHELKYSKRTKKYICEVCGTEYEAE